VNIFNVSLSKFLLKSITIFIKVLEKCLRASGLNFFLGNDKEEPYHINPKKNSAVVFPSNFVFTHEVCPISSGERYTLVTWIL